MGTTREHEPSLLDAYERLAAREAGGGLSDHGVESEEERILTESEGTEATQRHQYERLYRSSELEGGYRWSLMKVAFVLVGLGIGLTIAALLLHGFAD